MCNAVGKDSVIDFFSIIHGLWLALEPVIVGSDKALNKLAHENMRQETGLADFVGMDLLQEPHVSTGAAKINELCTDSLLHVFAHKRWKRLLGKIFSNASDLVAGFDGDYLDSEVTFRSVMKKLQLVKEQYLRCANLFGFVSADFQPNLISFCVFGTVHKHQALLDLLVKAQKVYESFSPFFHIVPRKSVTGLFLFATLFWRFRIFWEGVEKYFVKMREFASEKVCLYSRAIVLYIFLRKT